MQGFSSAEAFLNSNQLHDTACLILDVRMPGMSGLELQRQLVAVNCRIPIIFITSHGDDDSRARALEAGAVDFLYKPFREEALLKAIHIGAHVRTVTDRALELKSGIWTDRMDRSAIRPGAFAPMPFAGR